MKQSEFNTLGKTRQLQYINGLEESNRQLKELVKSLENPWIRVKDRLPKEKQEVLYYFKYTGTSLGQYAKVEYPKEVHGTDKAIYGDVFFNDDGFLTDDVTHWMPLPKQPNK